LHEFLGKTWAELENIGPPEDKLDLLIWSMLRPNPDHRFTICEVRHILDRSEVEEIRKRNRSIENADLLESLRTYRPLEAFHPIVPFHSHQVLPITHKGT
jgi:hypothetical protein